MTTTIIVQARMNSSRLPGKVMMPVLGVPLLELLIERLKRVKRADSICVACTYKSEDQQIVDLSQRLGVEVHRGSEENVLERYFEAAQRFQVGHVVRVTADSPLIDPAELDRLITYYHSHILEFDYVDNSSTHTYPLGMQAEVFNVSALNVAHREAITTSDQEHVTPFIKRQQDRFRKGAVAFWCDQSFYRLSVDTEDDFELVAKVIAGLYPTTPEFSIYDVLELLARNPEWANINRHIKQRTIN